MSLGTRAAGLRHRAATADGQPHGAGRRAACRGQAIHRRRRQVRPERVAFWRDGPYAVPLVVRRVGGCNSRGVIAVGSEKSRAVGYPIFGTDQRTGDPYPKMVPRRRGRTTYEEGDIWCHRGRLSHT